MQSARVSDRAQAQKDRILNAAEKAFIEHGFHAAGMALIAAEAEMSPGLIYRYYPGKHDIILAIIERQLEENRAGIRELYDSGLDVPQSMYEHYKQWCTTDPEVMNAALYAETSAEATRSASLAQAVAQSDAAVREDLARWMATPREQGGCGLPPGQAPVAALSMLFFMNGLAIHAIRQPGCDDENVRAAIENFVNGLFPSLA